MHVYNFGKVIDLPGVPEDDGEPFSKDHLQTHLASFTKSCHGDDQTVVHSAGVWADQDL